MNEKGVKSEDHCALENTTNLLAAWLKVEVVFVIVVVVVEHLNRMPHTHRRSYTREWVLCFKV